MPSTTESYLPPLDGTRAADDARLAAFSRIDPLEIIEDNLYTLGQHLDEIAHGMTDLGSMEECDNETCTKGSAVEYLGDELGKAQAALRTARDVCAGGEA